MRKLNINTVLLFLSILMINILIGCSNEEIEKNTFNIDQFASEMKIKGYELELKDVERDFLPTTRKRMIIGKEALDIYLFGSNKKMEDDAERIDSGGCGYSNGNKSIKVSWVSYPHFYKRGNIIVQYVGENEKIISDLIDIFGEQFAGYKSPL